MSEAPHTNWTNTDDFKPGSMGCHEALHMTAFFENAIEKELLDHPTIKDNPLWYDDVHQVILLLQRLYQSIGNEHLSA